MLLADMEQQGRIRGDWSIVGTDFSDRVLCSAAQAIYPQDRLRRGAAEYGCQSIGFKTGTRLAPKTKPARGGLCEFEPSC